MNLDQRIDAMRDEIIKSTQDIIKIKSVEAEPKGDMPFGEGVQKSLECALELSEKLGFSTKNVDNYAGHADFGDGEEVLGILVHVDVVPEGDNWDYPPMVRRFTTTAFTDVEPLTTKVLLLQLYMQ